MRCPRVTHHTLDRGGLDGSCRSSSWCSSRSRPSACSNEEQSCSEGRSHHQGHGHPSGTGATSTPSSGGSRFRRSNMDPSEADIKPGQTRLLARGQRVVVPINKIVRIQVTGADVIHSFAVPSFGIKTDAIPGRLNETWFKATQEGVFYGQCSELCGPSMPTCRLPCGWSATTSSTNGCVIDQEGRDERRDPRQGRGRDDPASN